MRAYPRLMQLEKSVNLISEFEVMRKENDWLNDYKGYTYSHRLKELLTRGLFEEHAKKADVGYANIEKAIVFNIEPSTKEILGLGGSSLLREKKSERKFESVLQSLAFRHRKIIPDLILDNFGLFFAAMWKVPDSSSLSISVPDTSNVLRTIFTYYNLNASLTWNSGAGQNTGSQIQMGSGLNAPARNNFGIQTALPNAPESGSLNTNNGAYTAGNTAIYQADANPTGGSGNVNEIISIGVWQRNPQTAPIVVPIALARDSITPTVSYTAGKLLRGSYTWQI